MKTAFSAAAGFLLTAFLIWYVTEVPATYEWQLPASYPQPPVPVDNPMSETKVTLGRRLFYDRRLSVNGSFSCASCHRQSLAFTDGLARSVGATGELHPRSSMSLVNAAYASRLTWANPLLDRLEFQALTPLFAEIPVEMGMSGRDEQIVELLKADVHYRELLPIAFPGDADPFSLLNALRAIASFIRSIVSFDSPYDRFLHGDPSAMSKSALRGLDLFFSEKIECFHCHGGYHFTDSSTHADASVESVGFHNNGLYNIDGNGAYPPDNTGLFDVTGERRDMGRFKAPTLRNIAVTAPYMHDGSIATLQEVIRHYEAGGRLIEQGERAGDGRRNPYKSTFVKGFSLTDAEREDLLAFLNALTDQTVLTDPVFADPFTETEIPTGGPN
ncbi:MAG: di-heme enzyme [Gammaproteobacteria bacterium]|nr:di-heme enzyme [Gammaproteobacteria bacterium]